MTQRNMKQVEKVLLGLQSSKKELLLRKNSRINTLDEIRSYLHRIRIDISELSILHVAGTKGKGSSCAFSESILRQYGLKTGFFSSPHLISVRERFRINGEPIHEDKFLQYFWNCYDRLVETKAECGAFVPMPAFFRFLTVLGFSIFVSEKVDVLVLEVGVGGRLDPTNVIPPPLACAITPIGFDHTSCLGHTLKEIAGEKAGIIKPGSTVYTIDQESSVLDVFQKKCQSHDLQLHVLQPLPATIPLGLQGEHQRGNAAIGTALALCWLNKAGLEATPMNPAALPKKVLYGLKQCQWPGRCQVIQTLPNLRFFIDGAHTKESMLACCRWFTECMRAQPGASKSLLFNCSHIRSPIQLLEPLAHSDVGFERVSSCPFDSDRPHLLGVKSFSQLCVEAGLSDRGDADTDAVYNSWQQTQLKVWRLLSRNPATQLQEFPSVRASVQSLREMATQAPDVEHAVLVTGSLYLVGAVLEALEQ